MKKVLILGALPENNLDFEKYETIIGECEGKFDEIYSPIDTGKFIGNNSERFKRALKMLDKTELIIGELSSASTGQGIEIGIAYNLKIPILIVAKKGAKVSGLIKGNPFVKEIIYYSDFIDLKDKLKNYFKIN